MVRSDICHPTSVNSTRKPRVLLRHIPFRRINSIHLCPINNNQPPPTHPHPLLCSTCNNPTTLLVTIRPTQQTMATLSPFRYIQLCRYMIQRFIADHPSTSLWKGKGKQLPQSPPSRIKPNARVGFATATMEHGRNGRGDDGPIAGPSRHSLPPNPRSGGPLRPDPDLPPEPSEIYRLMNDERLLVQGGVKPPREVIVLCHGESTSTCMRGERWLTV